jgi:hypothetical protein
VKLQGPKETTSLSIEGEAVPVRDGVVDVPEKHAATLAAHGFFPYVAPEARASIPPVMPSATRKTR